ncbi:olfactory receptor 52P1-like [Chrysemys picta bellii]|uniref:olfactory receptor 52P1-like n=1 Tax=Chrysemys picta bellii TaxID=8478 RepID=UPI0032B2D410
MDLEQVIFILVGILGLETFPCWIAIRLCSMWVLVLLGNCTMLLIIKTEYATTLSNPAVVKMGLVAATAGGVILVIPCPVLTLRLPYYFRQVIPHTHCEPTAGVKLACADPRVGRVYSISVALLVVGLDMILVAAFYSIILRAVFTISSSEANSKALATCTAHLCTLLVLCTSALFTFLTHRINRDVSPYSHMLASLYLLVLPLVNLLVYGVKTEKIRDKVSSIVNHGKKIASKP